MKRQPLSTSERRALKRLVSAASRERATRVAQMEARARRNGDEILARYLEQV